MLVVGASKVAESQGKSLLGHHKEIKWSDNRIMTRIKLNLSIGLVNEAKVPA